MPLSGKALMPREAAALCAKYWGGVGLCKAVATIGGESNFYIGADHPNIDKASDEGRVTSLDCGLFQINIPEGQIGSHIERKLRTDSLDPAVYVPVAEYNVERANELYHHAWTRNGKPGIREWQPWVAYTTGWATFPEWWAWSVSHEAWLPTGHYVQRAIPGVANYHLVIAKDRVRAQALFLAKKLQGTFKVKGELGIRDGIVDWLSYPSKPKTPPADGVGPRPVKNDGR